MVSSCRITHSTRPAVYYGTGHTLPAGSLSTLKFFVSTSVSELMSHLALCMRYGGFISQTRLRLKDSDVWYWQKVSLQSLLVYFSARKSINENPWLYHFTTLKYGCGRIWLPDCCIIGDRCQTVFCLSRSSLSMRIAWDLFRCVVQCYNVIFRHRCLLCRRLLERHTLTQREGMFSWREVNS